MTRKWLSEEKIKKNGVPIYDFCVLIYESPRYCLLITHIFFMKTVFVYVCVCVSITAVDTKLLKEGSFSATLVFRRIHCYVTFILENTAKCHTWSFSKPNVLGWIKSSGEDTVLVVVFFFSESIRGKNLQFSYMI